ncbi:unnamed protein product [Trichogramma brassicae]|uniref:Uncharacterized protein n=1 Tax=Trichogramma brassicae TaxID=86971 RepID=A0A6H5IQV4_9HYME|nr:unnamed protein product [Trichogramma brassicae]
MPAMCDHAADGSEKGDTTIDDGIVQDRRLIFKKRLCGAPRIIAVNNCSKFQPISLVTELTQSIEFTQGPRLFKATSNVTYEFDHLEYKLSNIRTQSLFNTDGEEAVSRLLLTYDLGSRTKLRATEDMPKATCCEWWRYCTPIGYSHLILEWSEISPCHYVHVRMVRVLAVHYTSDTYSIHGAPGSDRITISRSPRRGLTKLAIDGAQHSHDEVRSENHTHKRAPDAGAKAQQERMMAPEARTTLTR